MGIISGVGAVYTRRALRLQEAEDREAGHDIERGQPNPASATEAYNCSLLAQRAIKCQPYHVTPYYMGELGI